MNRFRGRGYPEPSKLANLMRLGLNELLGLRLGVVQRLTPDLARCDDLTVIAARIYSILVVPTVPSSASFAVGSLWEQI